MTRGEAGLRLDKFLAERLVPLSRVRLKALIQAGQVRRQNPAGAGPETITEPKYRVKPGDCFRVRIPAAVEAVPRAQAMALDVAFEDEYLIVIDKPAGLVVHPAPGNPDRTLVNALIAHCGDSLSGIGGVRRPGIVHRLDKDTSGLMVAAKTDAAHRGLAEQFAAHSLERAYLALVRGVPRPARGSFAGNIGRNPRNRKKMAVLEKGGKTALTRYHVQARFGALASLVECRLETGRTHQIRVHFAAAGHPVIGDPLYGQRGAPPPADVPAALKAALMAFPRQALHARTLGFRHPITEKIVKLSSTLPVDFRGLLETLEQF